MGGHGQAVVYNNKTHVIGDALTRSAIASTASTMLNRRGILRDRTTIYLAHPSGAPAVSELRAQCCQPLRQFVARCGANGGGG
jgi:hypothetical protein